MNEAKPRILLVTTKADMAADYVVMKLSAMEVEFYRLNTEGFPFATNSTVHISQAQSSSKWVWESPSKQKISLDHLKCIWFRRHRLPVTPPELLEAHAEYCLREAEWFLRGAIYSCAEGRTDFAWMSHPLNIQQAESKVYQLSVAKALGLRIPNTIISNDAQEVRDFYKRTPQGIVAKPLRLGYFDYGDRQTSVYTNQVNWSDLIDDASIKAAPVIYQELLQKRYDIRVTVVGDQVFAAAIDSQINPTAMIDWRKSDADNLPHHRHTLPPEIEQACINLLVRLGLQYGAIDFVLTPDNEYIFLEINPNGQWAWIEDKLQLPISEAIATWLFSNAH